MFCNNAQKDATTAGNQFLIFWDSVGITLCPSQAKIWDCLSLLRQKLVLYLTKGMIAFWLVAVNVVIKVLHQELNCSRRAPGYVT